MMQYAADRQPGEGGHSDESKNNCKALRGYWNDRRTAGVDGL